MNVSDTEQPLWVKTVVVDNMKTCLKTMYSIPMYEFKYDLLISN